MLDSVLDISSNSYRRNPSSSSLITSDNDCTSHASLLVPSELKSDQLPYDAQQLRAYFGDTASLRIPVTYSCYNSLKADGHANLLNKLEAVEESTVSCAMSTSISMDIKDHDSELTTTIAFNFRMDILFQLLGKYSDVTLHDRSRLNKKEARSSSSTVAGRPDTIISVQNCTFVIGEDKCTDDGKSALEDLKSKVKGLQFQCYGPVSFLIGYTAAGMQVQFWHISANGAQVSYIKCPAGLINLSKFFIGCATLAAVSCINYQSNTNVACAVAAVCVWQFTEVSDVIDISTMAGRVKLLLALAQLYRLLHLMSRMVPPLAQRHALFGELKRSGPGDVTLSFETDYIKKVAKRFSELEEYGTDFKILQEAYKAAATAANESESGVPYLITAKTAPYKRLNNYRVSLAPVGYQPDIQIQVSTLLL